MTSNQARQAYNALRAAILTVALGVALFTMAGGLGPDGGGGTVQQAGYVVEGMTGMARFNPNASLDASQIEGARP